MQQQRDERSLGELFKEFSQELTTLVRQELALARTEMGQKAAQAGRSVGFLAVGGAVAYAGLLALVAAAAIGLGQLGLPWWLATMIVGLAVAGLGALLLMKGLATLRRTDLAPRQTIETLREDQEWAKQQVR